MSGAIKQSDKSLEPGSNAIVMTDFLMWQERLTGKCLQSKHMPDGMKTVYWRMKVLLNRIRGGFKVGVLTDSSKQQQPPYISSFGHRTDPSADK